MVCSYFKRSIRRDLSKSVISLKASTVTAKSGSVWSKWYVAMQYVCALRADVENRTQKDSREHERSSKADQKGPQ